MSSATITPEPPLEALAGFVPVQVRTLRATKADSVDLFLQYELGREPRLYSRAGTCPEESQFAELKSAGVDNLLVRECDFATLSNDLLESFDRLLKDRSADPCDKFAALQLSLA